MRPVGGAVPALIQRRDAAATLAMTVGRVLKKKMAAV